MFSQPDEGVLSQRPGKKSKFLGGKVSRAAKGSSSVCLVESTGEKSYHQSSPAEMEKSKNAEEKASLCLLHTVLM